MDIEPSGRCPRCNTPTAAELRYCPTCGLRLGASDAGGPPTDPFLARVRAALLNEYDVAREIGRGGMAAVFLARDLRLPRRVALKVMLPELSYSTVMPQRFVGEARAAAMLDHPNIVPVFHAGEQDGLRYFAMRYIDGCSLERLQRARGPLPVSLACHLVAEIAAALDYAHGQGVVHRDVKPANVMIDRRFGRAIVTDFGIARVADGQRLTNTGLAIGTPEYMSPEQYASEDVTGASDQYALGAVAFQLLTGRPPFIGSQAEVLMAHVRQPPPSLRALRPDVPPVIEMLVTRMLAKAPADRWPSLADLAARFTEHVGSAALTMPAQLIALLPEPTAEDRVAQTPVSPAAGMSRASVPVAAPATDTPVADTPVADTPVADTPVADTPVAAARPTTPVSVPSLRDTAFTAGAAAAATAAPAAPTDEAAWEAPARSATFAGYRPVAPAEPEPVAPARRGGGLGLLAGGAAAVLLVAVALFATSRGRSVPPVPDTSAARPDSTSGAAGTTTPGSASGALASDTAPRVDSLPVAAAESVPAVDPAARRVVLIEPSSRARLTLRVGDTLRLRARLANGNGSAISTTELPRWSSGAPSAVEVSADGVVRAVAPVRRATLTATIGGVRGTANVRVDAAAAPPPPVTAAAPTPETRAPALPSAEEAQQEVDALAAAMRDRRVDEVRALFDAAPDAGPGAGRLLERLQRERDLRVDASATGAPELAGTRATVPVRVRLSWKRGGLSKVIGRDEATAHLSAQLERAGTRWRVVALHLTSPFKG